MWLSADWFVRSRVRAPVVPDRGSVSLVFTAISTLMRCMKTNLGTAYCPSYSSKCVTVFFFFLSLPFRFIFPPINSSKTTFIKNRKTNKCPYRVIVAFLPKG